MKQKIRVPWTDEELSILRNNYLIVSKENILKLLPNRTHSSIKTKARRLGIYKLDNDALYSFRHKKPCIFIDKGRIYKKDPSKYFDIWSAEMAYILGFIGADGCVYDNTLTIRLQLKDKQHLEKISYCMLGENCVRELSYNKKNNFGNKNLYYFAQLKIVNKYMVESLSKLGIIPNKSLILSKPENLPEKYELNYVMGLIDGDGCIFNYKTKKRNRIELHYLGSPFIVDYVSSIIKKYIGDDIRTFYSKKYRDNKKIKNLRIMTKKCEKFLSILYNKNTKLNLKRKFLIYKNFMEEKYNKSSI